MTRLVAALLGVGVGCAAAAAGPPEWPQFRGPGGAGVADGQKPPTKLGPDTNLKWKVAVPPGMSSPVIAGDRLFLTAVDGGKLYTVAHSRADGKELWRKEAPAKAIEPYHKTEGSPAASTPATDGERVVSYFGSCGLFCYDLAGNELWRHELPVAQTNNDFGTGSSPVIADGKVVLLRDQRTDSRLLALDLKDGSKAWDAKREGVQTSWGSACVWDTPRGKQVVVAGSLRVNGYDLATGKELWVAATGPAVPCTTPVVAGGNLVFAGWSPGAADFKMPTFDDILKQAGEEGVGHLTKAGSEKTFLNGFFDSNDTDKDGKITRAEWDKQVAFMAEGKNVAFALPPGGTGDVTKSLLWTAGKGLPYVPSPLAYDGLVYTLDMRARLSAVDAKTGKPVFEDEAVGLGSVYASPVAANGHLYLCGLDKKVVVVKAGESPDKVSTATLDDRIAATPAVVDGVIYIRTGKTLYAFAEKK
ncbi:MAG: PQQ-binding-like beta-propeller repeat protein [Gemmataceae bacterium]|nr:PQQ-binding-like beta-propeller repeat protein [Gemmataceae bacterium]